MPSDLSIEKLQRSHRTESFDCGQEDLNRFLSRYALQNQQAGASQTYVGLSDHEIICYYTLVVGQVEHADAPGRLTKGLAKHPVPVLLLARLAVSLNWQRKGVGSGLLKDAMMRCVHAADIVGIRAFLVHAKSESAVAFYKRFDFIPSPTDPFHMFLLLKDIRAMLAAP